MSRKDKNISRRSFLKIFGGGAVVAASALAGCKQEKSDTNDNYNSLAEPPKDKMTYRKNPKTGDKVSLLGYGMMRLPESGDEIDQKMVNRLVDYAIEHGVNYFDTSPAYCKGLSEKSTGIALSRYPRNK